MTIDELIVHLQKVKERHGNLSVRVRIPESNNMPESLPVNGSKIKYGSYGPYIQLDDRYWEIDDYSKMKGGI